MRWPFTRKPEKREQDYTTLTLEAIMAGALGSKVSVERLAVIGAVVRLYSLGFGLAKVVPEGAASRIMTPRLLSAVGRDLVLRGNSFLALHPAADGVMATPCSAVADGGGVDPMDWTYAVTESSPGQSYSRRVLGRDVLHFRTASRSDSPWQGVALVELCGVDAEALSAITTQIKDAGLGPFGSLLSTGQFEDEDARRAFDASLRSLKGGLATVDRGDFNESAGAGVTSFGLLAQRVDQGLSLTMRLMADSVASATGVPAALLAPSVSGGTSSREAWRQLGIVLAGTGQLVAEELSLKLGTDVTLDFSELHSADFRMRATGYKALVDADMDPSVAARLAGLDAGRE
ncbi:MAG: hypothetical protein OXK82_02060 [Deltaproteobacteria bacterium]|nr:hypothetical protein [Deltaproteobacteria bacterium]